MAEGAPDADGAPPVRVVKDMGLTHAEFFRTVQSLLVGEDADVRRDGITLRRGAATIEIHLGPEGARRLAGFELPRTAVEILFRGCTAADVAAFIERFDTRFRRGGG